MTDRRNFIHRLSLTIATMPSLGTALQVRDSSTRQGKPKPPPIAPELVKEFVVAGHGNLAKVKEMLARDPALVNATWDWGGGDFETALGGASHMARPEIAEFLLANGARLDVFCAAMLGRRAVVESCLAEFPGTVGVKGPHGISLLRHAELGKQGAIVELLKAAGAT